MDNSNKDSVTYDSIDDPNLSEEKKLIEEMKRRYTQDKSEVDELIAQEENNARLYFARYMDESKLPATEKDDYMMVPKLFSNMETVIPTVTRKSPEYTVEAYPSTKRNKRYASLLRKDIQNKWQMSEINNGWAMQPKQQENLRLLFNQKTIIWGLTWIVDENRMDVRPVKLCDIVAPLKKCRTVAELPYLMHRCPEKLGDIYKKWPEKAEELKSALPNTKLDEDSLIYYWKYWKNESVAYWYRDGLFDVLLGVDDNPYFNRETTDEMGVVTVAPRNHFPRPMKPYVIDTDIRYGTGLVAATSLTEISESTVRALDTDKNQIRRNLRMSNGLIIIDESFGNKEEAAKIDFSSRKLVQLKGTDGVAGHVEVVTGRAVDNAVINSMDDNRNIMDENTGANDVLRGEENAGETLGGTQIRKQSALTRNEPLFQLTERNAQEIGNWYAQFIAVFGDDEQTVYGASADSSKVEKISKKIFESRPEEEPVQYIITVKDGSTTPIDKKQIQAQAYEEATQGLIATVDYHRIMEREDPEGLAHRALLQLNDPAQLLQPSGQLDIDAILHIEGIIKGKPVEVFQTPDIEMMAEHLNTHAKYQDGEDIDEDIEVSFKGLDPETRMALKLHVKEELEILKQMKQDAMMQQTAVADKNKLIDQGIDPTAVALANNMKAPTENTVQPGNRGGLSQPNTEDVQQAPEQPSEMEMAGMG